MKRYNVKSFPSLILLIFILSACSLLAEQKKTICLNMIVKDEAPVIRRSLASVKGLIDRWVVVDTGSSDGTQEIIREFLKEIPGELHERPWVNFGHNRNEALDLARGKSDYVLFIDADEELIFSDGFKLPPLTKDVYQVYVVQPGNKFKRELIIKNSPAWKWEGVMHEFVVCNHPFDLEVLDKLYNSAMHQDGHRSVDPNKYSKDAAMLEKALENEPENTRYAYFLGQTLTCAGEYEKALKAYRYRAEMGGWDQEKFLALYYAAKMEHFLNKDLKTVLQSYCVAYQFRPTRAEPLCCLSLRFLEENNFLLAYLLAKEAAQIEMPSDIVHIEPSVYEYGVRYLWGKAALCLGKHEEATGIFQKLLDEGRMNDQLKNIVIHELKRITN